MSDEDRLRNRLHEQASDVPIVTDLDDVAARLGARRRNLRRPLAAAAVGVVVVAAVIGVVAEQAGRDTGHVRVAGPGGSAPDVPPSTEGHVVVLGPGTTLPAGASGLISGQGPTGPSGGGNTSGLLGVTGPTVTTLPANEVPLTLDQPTLPAPGPQQPADPQAARAAIAAAFATLGGQPTNEERAAKIEDGPALIPAMEQLRSGQYAPQVLVAKTVMMGIVFASPTVAEVEFISDLGGGSTSGPYVGNAVLTANGWQISRAFYCSLIARAGVNCP